MGRREKIGDEKKISFREQRGLTEEIDEKREREREQERKEQEVTK